MKESAIVDGLEAWEEAGRRLREVEPAEFARLLALARAFVSLHDRELEEAEIFQSRVSQILPGRSKASA
jgi:hypothetical protein